MCRRRAWSSVSESESKGVGTPYLYFNLDLFVKSHLYFLLKFILNLMRKLVSLNT